MAPVSVMDLNPPVAPKSPPAAGSAYGFPPPPPPIRETVVVPPQGPVPPQNPYVPSAVPPMRTAPPPRSGSSFLRRLMMVFLLLALLVALASGGWFAYTKFSGEKEATIVYWGLWEDDASIAPVIADFEAKHPKIKVSYAKQSQKQYRERLEYAITHDEGPDVFRFHNTWVAMLHSELAPVPEKVMSVADFSNTFYPVAATNLVAGTTIYGLPMETDGLGLYINEDIFAAKSVNPPTTWEEVLNLVPILTQKNEDGTITQSAIALGTANNVENFSDILGLMFIQNGANLITPTGTEAEETLVFYHKFADPRDEYYTWNETLDNSIYAFTTGHVAMILAPSWRAHEIHENNPSLKFRIVPVPQLPGDPVNWASYWVEGVSVKSQHQEAAWEFVKYLTSQEGATKLYTETTKTRLFGEPYARKDLADTIRDDPYAGAYITQAPNARSFPIASRTFDNGLNDELIKYLENAINAVGNGSSPTEALETVASGFQQVLARYGLVSASAPETGQ